MKISVFVATACCMLACKKSETVPPSGLFGKWELRRFHSGYPGVDSTFAAGNGTLYQFNSDSTYKYFIKGKLTSSGIYHYKTKAYKENDIPTYDEILFDSTTSGEMAILNGIKLTMGNTWSDGLAYDYEKVSN